MILISTRPLLIRVITHDPPLGVDLFLPYTKTNLKLMTQVARYSFP